MKFSSKVLISLAVFAIVLVIGLSNANAEDKILNTKIDSAVTALDKNGTEYVRLIVTEPREISGVSYQKSLPVMAFGANATPAKAYQAGDNLKAVVNYRKLADGRESYTVISFIE